MGAVSEALLFFFIGIGGLITQFLHARWKNVPVNGAWALVIFMFFAWTGIYIASPGLMRARAHGQFTQCQSNCKNIGAALELYKDDNRGQYPDSLSRLTPDYIREIPACSSAGDDTYSESYVSRTDPPHSNNSRYTFYCQGTNHSAVNVPMNFPRYTSSGGLESREKTSFEREIMMFQVFQLIALGLLGKRMREYKHNNLAVALILTVNALIMLLWYFLLLPMSFAH